MPEYTGIPSQLQALAALVNKMESRPQKGVPYGGGTHIAIPAIYSPGAPGWLDVAAEVAGTIALSPDKLTALVASAVLTPAERTQVAAIIATLTQVPKGP